MIEIRASVRLKIRWHASRLRALARSLSKALVVIVKIITGMLQT